MLMTLNQTCPHCGQTLPQTDVPGLPHLTNKQAALLQILLRAGQEGLTADVIMEQLYPDGYAAGYDTIKTHVSYLRKKLKTVGYDIKSHWYHYYVVRSAK